MPVEHVLILAVCGLGVFHGISLGTYLIITFRSKSIDNRLLGWLLLVFGLRISKSIILYYTDDLDLLLTTLGLTLILSFGPLFYFYIRSFLDQSFRLKKQHLTHAIPFIAFLVLNSQGLLNSDFYFAFGIFFIYLHFLTYTIISLVWQKQQFKQFSSHVNDAKKQWVNYIHAGILLIWVSYFMFLLDELIPYIAGPITYSLVIYPLSFWAIINKVLRPDEKKYQNSRLDHQKSLQIITDLETYFQNEKPFLNPDLKLPIVASELKVTPHALSQAVNENFKQNFQQYLNSHRVKSAQLMLSLKENSHLTISSIAFDCGFNSLSAFNNAFRRAFEKSPSQYRKEQNPST